MLRIHQIEKEGKELDEVRNLFGEYQKELDEDLCFQSFTEELKNPLKKYGPPFGSLLLAFWDEKVAGCIAICELKSGTEDEGKICEMKRLFVRPDYRSLGIGKVLVERIIDDAENLGYDKMKLDTLRKLDRAIRLYKQMDFVETNAYYHNPIREVVYMERKLLVK